jgi:ankyrin repeat protein
MKTHTTVLPLLAVGLLVGCGQKSGNDDPFPLHTAAVHFPDRIAGLIQDGQDLDSIEGGGRTPLQLAVTFQKDEGARELLAAGADPNAGKEDASPLADAARVGNAKIVRLLLESNADPNGRALGRTALHNAAIFGHTETMNRLLTLDSIDVNALENGTGYTPLHCAVQHNHEDIVTILLKHGVDMGVGDVVGNTALDLAKQKAEKGIQELLLKAQQGNP